MRQRNANGKSKISLMLANRTKNTKVYDRISGSIKYQERKQRYSEQKREDTDTKERINIHFEIKRLIGYGLPKKEVVERLREKFPTSKYQMFFPNWVNDQYEKIKPKFSEFSKEKDLEL